MGGGTINLVNNKTTSSGSSFMNVDNSSTSTTPIIDKIEKFEDLLSSGQVILVDNVGNPLKKVELSGDYDSEYEVASVDNDMARSIASESVGQDVTQEIQAICDNLDIRCMGDVETYTSLPLPKVERLLSVLPKNKLSLPDLSPTCMTLELADHSISHPVMIAEDVFVKVGTFHFLADFVVVDFDADPRVPLILGRSFLKTERALIDLFEGELTLRVGKEAITFNLDQTSRYSANYNDMTANRIDVIDMACEEYFDFLLEEVDAFLALEDDPTSPELINLIKYLPQVQKELKIYEAKTDKSSIDEPPEVELKDLPPHLEYAFLEGDKKLPVIIAKDLSVEEKTDLIMSLGKPRTLCTKKGWFFVVENEKNELIPTRLVTGWRVYIDYCKLNEATRKDHFPLPFMDQMLERFAGNKYYCFLDSFSGYFQILIDPKDQEKTTFTGPYKTFAYRCMPLGLCNASRTFQRCMMAIFHDMIEKLWKCSWMTSQFLKILFKPVSPI
nr:reverse transcriptase domain-containing protein [Tanacetum cinerariifolium]